MATADDIFRVDPIIRELGRLLFALANSERPGDAWDTVLLDVRFDEQGGFISKIRTNLENGEVASISTPKDISLQLIELNAARPVGQHRWHGFKLEVTATGDCQVDMNYDPACTDDPDFLSS